MLEVDINHKSWESLMILVIRFFTVFMYWFGKRDKNIDRVGET